MSLHCFTEKQASITALAEQIVAVSSAALERRPGFSLVLAGGSTPGELYTLLARPYWRDRMEWPRVHVFFGDERCVPPDHHDSNYRMARETLLSAVPIPSEQIHRIRGEADPDEEAAAYQQRIERQLPVISPDNPLFDLVLLGLGEDGHTASLFPGDAALQSRALATAVKAPRTMTPALPRISLTHHGIMLSRYICFLVHGRNKQEIVRAVLADSSGRYPAALIQKNTVSWYLSGMDCDII
ncbi:MAG: 6-phosphogluconolactonase [Desulfopila sp.]